MDRSTRSKFYPCLFTVVVLYQLVTHSVSTMDGTILGVCSRHREPLQRADPVKLLETVTLQL